MKQSPSMQNLSRLPTPVAQYLLAYMRQRRWLLFGRELLLLLVLLSGWILLCCLVDRLAHLGFAFRLGLWLVSLLGAILWLAQLLRRTLLAGEDLTHAALGDQCLRGDLAERLTTI